MVIIQSVVHDLSRFELKRYINIVYNYYLLFQLPGKYFFNISNNSEAFASELLENIFSLLHA